MRVKIHLNLKNAAAAESSLKAIFTDKSGNERSVTVGYADHLILHNVVPEVEEWKRQRISRKQGAFKTPCAYLVGDLVAWAGRPRGLLPDMHEPLLEAAEALRLPASKFDDAVRAAMRDGDAVGFNPKKAAVFYRQPASGGPITESFTRAAALVACHWRFMAVDGAFAPIAADELIPCPVPPSGFEKQNIPQGYATTVKRLEELSRPLR